jgi:hypothetical protein
MFKLSVANINKEDKLITWSNTSNIDYIKNLEKVTHNTGYVLNLSFLNISFTTINI